MLLDFNWQLALDHTIRMIVAYLFALPVAWNRERESRSAGLRTFPLVSVGACGFMILGVEVIDDVRVHGRVIHGVITGIGFIGGGAILKSKSRISGTSTAASIWSTGAIGIAVAYGRLEIAFVLSLMNFLTLKYVARLKKVAKEQPKDGNE